MNMRMVFATVTGLVVLLFGSFIYNIHNGFCADRMVQPDRPAALRPDAVTSTNQDSFVSGSLQVPSGVRLLVFSPHPDDESLAAGGLIQRVIDKHGSVHVVFMTNGDGYPEGVKREFKRASVAASDYIEYGVIRHNEALKAISALGLHASDGIFLGFPDQGLDPIWEHYWSRRSPFTSPFTRFNHPEYQASFSRRVEYAGADLIREVERTIERFKPDWIVLPDPRDYHPDHATTGLFVLDAIKSLREKGEAFTSRVKLFAYLVHYPNYPSSTAWEQRLKDTATDTSASHPAYLWSGQWVSFQMSSEELANKQRALAAYPSQLLVLGDLMRQFIRPAELFDRLDTARVTAVPLKYLSRPAEVQVPKRLNGS